MRSMKFQSESERTMKEMESAFSSQVHFAKQWQKPDLTGRGCCGSKVLFVWRELFRTLSEITLGFYFIFYFIPLSTLNPSVMKFPLDTFREKLTKIVLSQRQILINLLFINLHKIESFPIKWNPRIAFLNINDDNNQKPNKRWLKISPRE